MKAEVKPGYNKDRVTLAEKLPLKTPFTLYVASSHICNFRCSYCTQSWPKEKLEEIKFQSKNIDQKIFNQLAEQIKEFPDKLKLILFTGMGEPLINKNLPEMISYLKKLDAAERIELYTNGALLSKEMTHALVNSGLHRIRISIQGLSAQKYKEVAGVDIDFDQFIGNIKYLYENRKDCKVYIKIIDAVLEEGEEEKFYNLFGNICDEIYIEHLVFAQKSMGNYDGSIDDSLTMYQEKAEDKDVCPLLFYIMQIDVEGNVFPCTPLGLPADFSLGNIREQTLLDIWTGEKLKNLRLLHLKKNRAENPVCSSCQSFTCITHATDNLDKDAEELVTRFE